MAAESVQLGLLALLSAPVIQTVFQSPKADPETEPHPPSTAQDPRESSSSARKNAIMTDPVPVHLAPPLPVSEDAERVLFVQNALHGGSFQKSDADIPTSVEEPETSTAGIEENIERSPESTENKEPTTTQKNQDPEKMGLLSVITGNISPPRDISSPANRDSSNGHGIISNDIQANTVGPTTKGGIVRSDTVKSHLTAGTTGTAGTGTGTAESYERATTPLPERAITPAPVSAERAITPGPVSAASEERTGPTPGATGDGYSPLPVIHTTGDRITPESVGTEPLRDERERADIPVHEGIEEGVPAKQGLDGTYEGVRDSGPLRPGLGDDKPSRSYIRPESVVQGSRNGSALNGNPPRSVDYATASPANLGHSEQPVVSLPAGGALHGDKEGSTDHGHGTQENGYASQNGQQEPQFRQLVSEGQAYRSDGGVPGQPQPQQQHQYGQYAAPLAGAGVAGAAAYGLQQHHQQQQQQQQQQQYQPSYQNDPSFAAERAMSPGPNTLNAGAQDPSGQMSRLSFQDHAQTQGQQHQQSQHGHGGVNGVALAGTTAAGVGPSPGPPVGAFAPTSAMRRTPEPTTDLARNSTMRSTATGGLSRGSTLRRGGAFANGAALQGGGIGETYGRDDIHARTLGADRGLLGAGVAGAAGMQRISKDEARDAKRLSKMIKVEGKTEAAAVKGAIRELESLQKVQRAAHAEELKAQQKHAKFTRVEHKARLRFLKEKERYEKVEAQLRSIEADYEAKREHASQQTDLLAEKTQELNDLRAQKAADDRERELKLLALKNPGHA